MLASIILAIVALPMLAIAVALKVSSGSPIFFRQLRYGLGGKQVRILRFRTTSVCGEPSRGREARRDDVPVSTRLGRLLRRTSLDALPQLLQVISGELSLVGPAPHATVQSDAYHALLGGQPLPATVKPGITGWAQVNGCPGYTESPAEMWKRVQCDLEYMRGWSLLWDLKILVLSIFGTRKPQDAG